MIILWAHYSHSLNYQPDIANAEKNRVSAFPAPLLSVFSQMFLLG